MPAGWIRAIGAALVGTTIVYSAATAAAYGAAADGQIAYESEGSIRVIAPDGSGATTIIPLTGSGGSCTTRGASTAAYDPAWSADGRKLAYVSQTQTRSGCASFDV